MSRIAPRAVVREFVVRETRRYQLWPGAGPTPHRLTTLASPND